MHFSPTLYNLPLAPSSTGLIWGSLFAPSRFLLQANMTKELLPPVPALDHPQCRRILPHRDRTHQYATKTRRIWPDSFQSHNKKEERGGWLHVREWARMNTVSRCGNCACQYHIY
ncbi:hypothetical protein LIA77_04777 [Sarocladium implicatum]|nr:hypothetical protein LIA77_04777 [Sarocladium implicatum]